MKRGLSVGLLIVHVANHYVIYVLLLLQLFLQIRFLHAYYSIHQCCIAYNIKINAVTLCINNIFSSRQKSSRFFSVQRNATKGKHQRNGNATESLAFRSCNSLEPHMLYLVFNSTFPSLPPGAKTLRTSNSYLVLLFSYSRWEVHA